MTSEKKPYNLAEIEPIAPPPEEDEPPVGPKEADRVGLASAAALGSTPAVGVAAAVEGEPEETPTPRDERTEPRGR
jgi:hypothetical protein